MGNNMDIDELLNLPYWLIDFLPYRVPADSAGQFFAIEDYYLKSPQIEILHRQFLDILLKLNCYYAFRVLANDECLENPRPEYLKKMIEDCGLDVLVGDTLIQYSSDDTHMTVYNPSEQLLTLIKTLAQAEGLFVWQPEEFI